VERFTRISAYAWSVRDGSVLLARIAPGRPDNGKWTLPGGGLDWGEHPEEGMARELHEETGLHGEITGFIGIDSITGAASPLPGSPEGHAIRIVYRVEVDGDVPRVTEIDGSVDCAAWHRLEDLESLPIVNLVEYALKASGDAPLR
jgi:ADP-ribose pyrophosphatase YjhB (NUDIX family)